MVVNTVTHRRSGLLVVSAVIIVLMAGWLLYLALPTPNIAVLAPLALLVVWLVFARPEWAPVFFVLLACTLPVMAYGIEVQVGDVSVRPHTVVLVVGVAGGIATAHFWRGRLTWPEVAVWCLLAVIIVSWSVNLTPGLALLINPATAWLVLPLTVRLGRRVNTGWVIALVGVAGAAVAVLAMATVLTSSSSLFDNLFQQGAFDVNLLTPGQVGAGRGFFTVNGEGFQMIAFCLMVVTFLLNSKYRWLTGPGAALIGGRTFTSYGRSIVLVYLTVLVLMVAWLYLKRPAFWRRLFAVTALVVIVWLGIGTTAEWLDTSNTLVAGVAVDLVQDWTSRWQRFWDLDIQLSDFSGTGGGTIQVNQQAVGIFMENPKLLLFGAAMNQGNSYGVHHDVSGPLSVMLMWGILGLALVAWFILACARSALFVLRNPLATQTDLILAYTYIFSLIAYLGRSTLRFSGFALDGDIAAMCLVAGLVETTRLRLVSLAARRRKLLAGSLR